MDSRREGNRYERHLGTNGEQTVGSLIRPRSPCVAAAKRRKSKALGVSRGWDVKSDQPQRSERKATNHHSRWSAFPDCPERTKKCQSISPEWRFGMAVLPIAPQWRLLDSQRPFSPVGAIANSPALQRWGAVHSIKVPEGRLTGLTTVPNSSTARWDPSPALHSD